MFAQISNKVAVGLPITFRNLSLTPIFAKNGPLLPVAAKSLEEALADGTFKVMEVSAEGSIPELRVRNFGDTPVLILDGEELVGAKQNRIANVTIMVAPRSEIVIPVSCIEAGRWAYGGSNFSAPCRVVSHKIRSLKAEFVTKNLKERRGRFANQSAVWDGVSDALFALGASSPTGALSDGFASRADAIDTYLAAFTAGPGQIGVISRIDGVLAGLDLFGSETIFTRAFSKLVRGAALQALAGLKNQAGAAVVERDFLNAALAAPADRFSAVGMGNELRIQEKDMGGGALELDGNLVHLFAFPRT